jgi:hypothetical protein
VLQRHAMCGVLGAFRAAVKVTRCTASTCGAHAYGVHDRATLTVADCCTLGCGAGCGTATGAVATLRNLHVDGVSKSGTISDDLPDAMGSTIALPHVPKVPEVL